MKRMNFYIVEFSILDLLPVMLYHLFYVACLNPFCFSTVSKSNAYNCITKGMYFIGKNGIKPQHNYANQQNRNKGSIGTNHLYNQNQCNRGKQLYSN